MYGLMMKKILKKIQSTLLENQPLEPVENAHRYRFSNRYPHTETNDLALRHRVFHPVP